MMRLNPLLSPLLSPDLTAETQQCFEPKKKQEKKKALHNRRHSGQKEAE
ncbi:hypothetical protein J2Y45_006732 [Dyadobacter sp. BE34]|uniref:Uncharacterized protein n=1 Tax=Dyadobacter fermentans TaxID=94254 RepID=A0ABU1R8D3_9BACT|nr:MULTISPECIES: hypothetical protein [Dyadobacter]MDR6809655.1 hypothetical protein [Dyadobacter fermentans]MDR7047333.1 hypothetical protein [Dyadobacter sp. BE242]MDR7201568.1 hypothetical protein [Dyadobacter sp. BE34]MDR7219438.1 hypothetical protein [Dyadobacter sp. BE31]MDR7267167.1 hypothetical protein [Dyadobacter sp. BE32]